MNQWESVKRSFGQSGSYLTKEIGPLIMRGVESSHWYDEDDGSVKLTRYVVLQSKSNVEGHLTECSQDVEALFEPVVNDIVRLVSDQADEVKTKGRLVDVCFLGLKCLDGLWKLMCHLGLSASFS